MFLYIATPFYAGKALKPYCESMLALLTELHKRGIPTRIDFVGNESLIQRARNIMADRFYKSDCTHLLFIDGDIGFSCDDALRLLLSGKEVVAGIYPKKHINWDKVAAKVDGTLKTSEPVESVGLDYNINIDYTQLTKIENGFMECLDVATGFMLISKEAYVTVHTAHPELECVNDVMTEGVAEPAHTTYRAVFDCIICDKSRRYLSEDFSFIRRCQNQGVQVHGDLLSSLSHTGSMVLKHGLFAGK